MSTRHFLTLLDCSPIELKQIINRASELKNMRKRNESTTLQQNPVLAMLFDKASTRTRVAFETAMAQLGGSTIFLAHGDSQLSRGEPIEDTARVISSMVDIVVIRTFEHERLAAFANASSVPVINGLTDDYHPCQLLADLQTYQEKRGAIQGKTVTWVGDGNNMCHSYINAARQLDFQLNIACPKGFEPQQILLDSNSDRVQLFHEPVPAVEHADLVITDVWASMGNEDEQNDRINQFSQFQVNESLMNYANKGALFMHCLPAHRGEEVSAGLLNDSRSVVWQEAENRLYAHKALLEFLLT